MKEINSNIVGKLVQDERFEDWWESMPVKVPFFENKTIKIIFSALTPEEDKDFITEADEALKAFLAKSQDDRFLISELVYKNCMDFLNAVGYDEDDAPLWEIKDKNKIWKFVYPQEIHVSRRHRRDKNIYLNIACECEWEHEHGLQLVFRKGKQITRVSSQDGHVTEADAYDKPDEEDDLLNTFNT